MHILLWLSFPRRPVVSCTKWSSKFFIYRTKFCYLEMLKLWGGNNELMAKRDASRHHHHPEASQLLNYLRSHHQIFREWHIHINKSPKWHWCCYNELTSLWCHQWFYWTVNKIKGYNWVSLYRSQCHTDVSSIFLYFSAMITMLFNLNYLYVLIKLSIQLYILK